MESGPRSHLPSRPPPLELPAQGRDWVSAIGDRGHIALDAFLAVGLDEVPPDLGVLPLVVNKRPALTNGLGAPRLERRHLSGERADAPIHSDVAGRNFPGAHVLVEPGVGWDVDA